MSRRERGRRPTEGTARAVGRFFGVESIRGVICLQSMILLGGDRTCGCPGRSCRRLPISGHWLLDFHSLPGPWRAPWLARNERAIRAHEAARGVPALVAALLRG